MLLHRFSGEKAWQSPWLETLPTEYFEEFGNYLAEDYFPRSQARMNYNLDWCKREFDVQLFIRLQQSKYLLVPWIEEGTVLSTARILEIGAGTGSSTIPLAQNSKQVVALDISQNSIDAGARRASLLKVGNVEHVLVAPDWLQSDKIKWPGDLKSFDLIVCYAVLEHMIPAERLNFLGQVWKEMRSGAIIVFFETPNRLAPNDWHSSGLPFAQILPDDLVALYYSKAAKNNRHVRVARDTLATSSTLDETIALYRWGRGVSFHEFDIAIGIDALSVVNDGYSEILRKHRDKGYGVVPSFDTGLCDALSALTPPVPRGFARPSLDLMIRKL